MFQLNYILLLKSNTSENNLAVSSLSSTKCDFFCCTFTSTFYEQFLYLFKWKQKNFSFLTFQPDTTLPSAWVCVLTLIFNLINLKHDHQTCVIIWGSMSVCLFLYILLKVTLQYNVQCDMHWALQCYKSSLWSNDYHRRPHKHCHHHRFQKDLKAKGWIVSFVLSLQAASMCWVDLDPITPPVHCSSASIISS